MRIFSNLLRAGISPFHLTLKLRASWSARRNKNYTIFITRAWRRGTEGLIQTPGERRRVKSNSVDGGANSSRNRSTECSSRGWPKRGEESQRDERMTRRRGGGWGLGGGWLNGWLQPASGEQGRWNFARARLHPSRLPPPLDAEGSWTARVRCQFCARSPPWRCQPARDLLATCSKVFSKWSRTIGCTHARTHALIFDLRFRFILPLGYSSPRPVSLAVSLRSDNCDDNLWNGRTSQWTSFGTRLLTRVERVVSLESGTWHASAGDYHAGRDLREQQCTWRIVRGRKFGRVHIAFSLGNMYAVLKL